MLSKDFIRKFNRISEKALILQRDTWDYTSDARTVRPYHASEHIK